MMVMMKSWLCVISLCAFISGCGLVPREPHTEVGPNIKSMLASNELEKGYTRTYICGDYMYSLSQMSITSDSKIPSFLPRRNDDWSWSRSPLTIGPFDISIDERQVAIINSEEAIVIDYKNPAPIDYAHKLFKSNVRFELNPSPDKITYINVYTQQSQDGYVNSRRLIATPSRANDCNSKRVVFYQKIDAPFKPSSQASAWTASSSPAGEAKAQSSNQLIQLKALLDQGLITKNDYDAKKAELENRNNRSVSQSRVTKRSPNDPTGWVSFNSSKDGTTGLYYNPQDVYRYSVNEFVAVVRLTSSRPLDDLGTISMFYLVIGDCQSRKSAYKYKERFNTSGSLVSKTDEIGYIQPYEELKSTDAFPPLFDYACGRIKSLPQLTDFSKLVR